jgi:hypothetical protein
MNRFAHSPQTHFEIGAVPIVNLNISLFTNILYFFYMFVLSVFLGKRRITAAHPSSFQHHAWLGFEHLDADKNVLQTQTRSLREVCSPRWIFCCVFCHNPRLIVTQNLPS